MKLSDYVVEFVADQGVKHVFMLPGGGAMHLNDSLGKCERLAYVCNLHEQASAIAAEAYARVTNDLACAMVTTGPGGTNAITGVAGAWLDSTPVLFLSGQVKRADLKGGTALRMLGVQEIDIVSLVAPITKYAVTVTDPVTIRYHLERAVWLARNGRRGPVWIDIPLDVQAAQVDPAMLDGFTPPTEREGECTDVAKAAARVLAMLAGAERPVILAGNGVRSAGAVEELRAFAERHGIPVLTTWLGHDLIADDHQLFAGRPGGIAPRYANFALQNSDLLLIIGARMDLALMAYAPERLARGARKVMVDVDPAEIAKLRDGIEMPVVADAGDFLRAALSASGADPAGDYAAWRERCRSWKARYPLVQPEHRSCADGVSMYHFSDVLSDELASDDVITPGSSGFACEIFLLVARVKAGQRLFHNRGTGAMGFGLPASIGACIASGRRTISVDGDGGFQMNIQELATVATHGLPIKFFVVNNGGYASIRTSQANYFGRLVAADATSGVRLPDVTAVAAAYGLPTARINSPDGLRARIREVLDRPGPVVCEVRVPDDEPRGPRVASAQRPDGSMVSKPLEDLWPFLDREEFLANMIVAPVAE
ncbi:thiamine pyrophosphate-binding protein [Roseisolibacter agri]|uniref:Acetolactate synthase n=1 Tax=Roseisolibacter agri TaxID=2014610 RepID=A0AA37VFD3_9BACT|nr:thiamine pyrophosphate-binding protein [Roseisolibacter agri]GLC26699.1 acetolactate synthase [Roseisolibacter agri]